MDRYLGSFRNPEDLAYYRPGLPRQPLYIVRFQQSEVWPDYRSGKSDTVAADIYEHWLEPVEKG